RWVRGIAAAGYNPFPAYPTQVLSIANNYLHPGPTPSAEFALYRFSTDAAVSVTPAAATVPASSAPAISPSPVASRSASAPAAAAALDGALQRSRYMSERCDPNAITDWPNYEGRNVRRCQYSVTSGGKTLSALVYLLNPPEENIVARIEDACRAIGLV